MPARRLLPPWTYLTFTQNLFMAAREGFGSQLLSPTWSLAIEEQFYLLAPLAVRLIAPRRVPLVLVAGILAAPALRLSLGVRDDGTAPLAAYVLMPARADALLLGVLAAWAWQQESVHRVLREAGAWLLLPAVPCAAAVAVLALRGGGNPLTPEMARGGFSWLALGYTLVVLAAAGQARALRPLVWPPLQALGRVSYATYLLHLPILRILHFALLRDFPSVTGAGAAVTLLAFLVTVGLAAVSWRFFEGPIVSWGHRASY